MVDRIRKVLRRLALKEQRQLTDIVYRIIHNDLAGLDLKKLQGREDVYRVRKGDFRIIFCQTSNNERVIIAIERRSDATYGEF